MGQSLSLPLGENEATKQPKEDGVPTKTTTMANGPKQQGEADKGSSSAYMTFLDDDSNIDEDSVESEEDATDKESDFETPGKSTSSPSHGFEPGPAWESDIGLLNLQPFSPTGMFSNLSDQSWEVSNKADQLGTPTSELLTSDLIPTPEDLMLSHDDLGLIPLNMDIFHSKPSPPVSSLKRSVLSPLDSNQRDFLGNRPSLSPLRATELASAKSVNAKGGANALGSRSTSKPISSPSKLVSKHSSGAESTSYYDRVHTSELSLVNLAITSYDDKEQA